MLLGLRLAKELAITHLELLCDSRLVASQLQGEYEAKNGQMEQYMKLTRSMIARFTKFTVAQVSRSDYRMADFLANLVFRALYPCHVELNIMDHPLFFSSVVFVCSAPWFRGFSFPCFLPQPNLYLTPLYRLRNQIL